MTSTLAVELAQTGITVNCVCPGPFATEINQPVIDTPKATAALLKNVPMNRSGQLNEIKPPPNSPRQPRSRLHNRRCPDSKRRLDSKIAKFSTIAS